MAVFHTQERENDKSHPRSHDIPLTSIWNSEGDKMIARRGSAMTPNTKRPHQSHGRSAPRVPRLVPTQPSALLISIAALPVSRKQNHVEQCAMAQRINIRPPIQTKTGSVPLQQSPLSPIPPFPFPPQNKHHLGNTHTQASTKHDDVRHSHSKPTRWCGEIEIAPAPSAHPQGL